MGAPWVDYIYYAYRPNNFNEVCFEETEVPDASVYAKDITIQCAVTKPYALLEICLADADGNKRLKFNSEEVNGVVPLLPRKPRSCVTPWKLVVSPPVWRMKRMRMKITSEQKLMKSCLKKGWMKITKRTWDPKENTWRTVVVVPYCVDRNKRLRMYELRST